MNNVSPFARRGVGEPVLFEVLEGRQLLAAHPVKATAVVKKPVKPAVVATPHVNNVSGFVYYDNHGDGVYDTPVDTPHSGVNVYLDANANGKYEVGERYTTSAADGSYSFANVTAGVPIRETNYFLDFVSTTNYTAGVTPTGTGTNYNIGNFNRTIAASSVNGITEVSIDPTHTWLTIQTTFGLNATYYRVRQNLVTDLDINGTAGDDQLIFELGSGGDPAAQIEFTFDGKAGNDTVLVRAPNAGWADSEFDGSYFYVGNFNCYYAVADRVVYQGGAGDDLVKLLFNNVLAFYGGDGGNDVIDVSSGSFTPLNDMGIGYNGEVTNQVTVNANTQSTIKFDRTQHLKRLKINNGSVSMTNGAVLHTNTFLLTGGNLDPGTGAIIIDDTSSLGSSTQLNIANNVKSGYANGQQNGNGIRSAVSAGTNYRIGYALAGDALFFGSSNTATFFGETVGLNAMLIRRTLVGDADLDGGVSINDFNRIGRRFGTPSGVFWSGGDFDYDFGVSINDFNLLAGNFGKTT